MAVFNKPQFNTVWASSGDKVAPEVSKISVGWAVEIPPHQYANWLENRRDEMLAHLNQAGVPSWDSTVEYQASKSYVQGTSTGVIYKCLVTNTNVNPELDLQGNWEVAFQRSGEALLKSQNLADVPDKALARTNLGIATTADYDMRYLLKSSNLGDIPNKSSARGNIDVYSRQEVIDLLNNKLPAGEVAYFATSDVPVGWLVCDGSSVSRTVYSRLFAAIGTRFGAGNGSTTFNIPDLRGEFIRGVDLGRGLDPGRITGTLQLGSIESHTHTLSIDRGGEHTHVASVQSFAVDGGGNRFGVSEGTIGGGAHSHTGRISATGGSETRPRNVALLACIRT